MATIQPDPLSIELWDLDAEKAVLGAILIDPDSLIRIQHIDNPAIFHSEKHQWIWNAAVALSEQGNAIDFVTLCNELDRAGNLNDRAVEPWYITSLINATPTSVNIEHYAEIIDGLAERRRLVNACGEAVALACNKSVNGDEIRDQIITLLLGTLPTGKTGPRELKSIVSEFYDRIEAIQQGKGKKIAIPSGYQDLDTMIQGFYPSDLIVIAGRPGMGKTSLAMGLVDNIGIKQKLKVAVFSLEMSEEQNAQRLISGRSGISTGTLRSGEIEDKDWAKFMWSLDALGRANVWIDDTPGITPGYLRAALTKLQVEHGVDLAIVDYLQLMKTGSRGRGRYEDITEISGALKGIAKSLNIPIIALSQLSRACEGRNDKRPMPSDLRDSGALEQDSDIIMFLYRDEVYNPETEYPNVAELIVSKHRHGPTGVISLYWKKEIAKFVDAIIRASNLDYEL